MSKMEAAKLWKAFLLRKKISIQFGEIEVLHSLAKISIQIEDYQLTNQMGSRF